MPCKPLVARRHSWRRVSNTPVRPTGMAALRSAAWSLPGALRSLATAFLLAFAASAPRLQSVNIQVPLKPVAVATGKASTLPIRAASSPGNGLLRVAGLTNPVWTSADNLRDPSVLQLPDGKRWTLLPEAP